MVARRFYTGKRGCAGYGASNVSEPRDSAESAVSEGGIVRERRVDEVKKLLSDPDYPLIG
jgi:hypothetical protein